MKTLKFLALVAIAIACIVVGSAAFGGAAVIVMPERHAEAA